MPRNLGLRSDIYMSLQREIEYSDFVEIITPEARPPETTYVTKY